MNRTQIIGAWVGRPEVAINGRPVWVRYATKGRQLGALIRKRADGNVVVCKYRAVSGRWTKPSPLAPGMILGDAPEVHP